MTAARTNQDIIERWGAIPRSAHVSTGDHGDFAKTHALNDDLLRLIGAVDGRRVLDAGCGQGYLSRLLAATGAEVTGIEAARSSYDYCVEVERERSQGIRFLRADLVSLPDELVRSFDVVVSSMVLGAIPDWRPAMRRCVDALRPGGRLVIALNHPCFEQLWGTWKEHGAYRLTRYLDEYEVPGMYAPDFHRPLAAYLNEVCRLGLRVLEVAEPRLDPAVAEASGIDGIEAYVHLPNFVVVAAVLEAPADPSQR